MDYAFHLVALLTVCPISHKVSGITQEDVCLEVVANESYSCEWLGLQNIPESIPATTEILDFSFNSLYVLYNSTFSRLRNLKHLDLTRCNINWIYDNVFLHNTQLNTLVLIGNPILFIKDLAFSGAVSLNHLFMEQTSITSLSHVLLKDLDNLETLSLGNNFISSVELPNTFQTRNLRVLDFQFNGINKILAADMEMLKKVENLSLILKGNNINFIEPNSFNSSKLHILDLTSCATNTDLSVLIDGLNGLSTNILKIGSFEDVKTKNTVSPYTLRGLCNISMKAVSLQHADLDDLSSDMFFCFPKVQKLDLTNTYIKSFPIFNNSLTELILNHNKIGSLCDIHSDGFTLLKSLHIKRNQNEMSLGASCLKHLSSLQYLDLSHSNIASSSNCCSSQFSGLTSLKYLNLSYNNIQIFFELAFSDNDKLEVLDLAYTPITINGSVGPFNNLKLLSVMNLSHSLVDVTNEHLLQGLRNLVYLNLEKCVCQSGVINTSLFSHALNLEILILSSCKIKAIEEQAFSTLKKLVYIDLSGNMLTVFSINIFGELSHIHLNLAFNMITTIQLESVSNVSGTSIINLSHNPLDCSCANIQFILWYKENIHIFEDTISTLCWSPQSSNGKELSKLIIICKISSGYIFLITVSFILIIIALILAARYYRKKRYASI
ncbi:CD180 antigen [Spea bombifrons]|uniref:CD180 antigen n=1 Tax=Spea bombifrons TaxID=233779 RepID=UPI002349069B|nr:CD180 antigen [Spea bombifrons]